MIALQLSSKLYDADNKIYLFLYHILLLFVS